MGVIKGTEVATIDVVLVTVQSYDLGADEIALDTSNKVDVTVATETQDRVALIVKGRLIAQKPPVTTVTGNTIVLTDNVFNDELVKLLQGGTIKNDLAGNFTGYTPPVVGSGEEGKLFKTRVYSAIYNAAGVLTGYERITYPNCKGVPFAFSSEDGVFRASDYTINSAPANGEAPYDLDIVSELPKTLENLTVTSVAGTTTGYTKITVVPSVTYGNTYMYKVDTNVSLPNYGDVISTGYTAWNGSDEISATAGNKILMVEVDSNSKAVKAGITTIVVAS